MAEPRSMYRDMSHEDLRKLAEYQLHDRRRLMADVLRLEVRLIHLEKRICRQRGMLRRLQEKAVPHD